MIALVARKRKVATPMRSPITPESKIACASDHSFKRRGSLTSGKPCELGYDRALGRLTAEDETGDGNRDQQHRGEGKHGEEGDRRAKAHRPVVPPSYKRCLEQRAHLNHSSARAKGRYNLRSHSALHWAVRMRN